MVVILAEGAANKRRTSPCERLELIVAGIHIFDDLLRRQRIVVVVCVGMVHQLAAAVYDGLGLTGCWSAQLPTTKKVALMP